MGHSEHDPGFKNRRPWNAGRQLGAKRALEPQQVWAVRFWLDSAGRVRDRALFDLAIDSKLRGCDIVELKIGELVSGGSVRRRAIVSQRKTGRPVQFELLEPARTGILAWPECRGVVLDDYAFPSRVNHAAHLGMGLGLPRFGGHRERFRVRCLSNAEEPSPLPHRVPPTDDRAGPRRP